MNPQDTNQASQPVQTPQQQPATEQQAVQPQAQQQTPATPLAQAKSPSSGLKKTGGVLSIILGVLTVLISLASLSSSVLFGLAALALGIFWLVLGVRIPKAPDAQAAKYLNNVAVSAIAYTGILSLFGFFLGTFRPSSALLPLIFAIAIAVVSSKFKKTLG